MGAWLAGKLGVYAVVAVLAFGAGGYAMKRWDAPTLIKLTDDLREARASALAQQRALAAVRDACAAGDAATTQAHDLNAVMQRAIDDAREELNNAQGDDADPLAAQFERLRRGRQDPAPARGGPGNAP